MFFPRDPKPGDPIRADLPAAQDAEILRLGKIKVGPGLEVRSGPSGIAISLLLPDRIFIRLTGSSGSGASYPWVQVYHLDGQTWETSTRTGSLTVDPVFERGGATNLTGGNVVYEARRCPTSGEWLFDA